MPPTVTDDQQMLMLALASYQGFWLPHLPGLGASALRHLLDHALASFEPLGARWKLAWGPASLRASVGLLDEVLAYVARDEGTTPPRYAVVLRGTNPLSLSDWIFGDCWVLRDNAWEFGADREGVNISRSSALGLAVVRSLQAAPVGHDPAPPSLLAALRSLGALAEHSRLLVEASVSRAVGAARAEFEAMLDGEAAVDASHFDALVEDARERGRVDGGVDLATFLAGVMKGATPPEQVWVTGHSKGAALATATALWLADTQDSWDPAGRAQVHCTTFAGPTVGNPAFAARVTDRLGARHRRVANRRDVVTHGWAFEALTRATTLDGDEAPEWFRSVARRVADIVSPLEYTHVEAYARHFDGDPQARVGGPVGQMIYHHLHAYIAEAGLSPKTFGLPEFPLAPLG